MSISLKGYLDSCDFAAQLREVNECLATAQSQITFFGKRVLVSPNYSGSISLEEVVVRVNEAALERCKATNLKRQERVQGIEITEKLAYFYKISQCNCLARLLNVIREFTFLTYTPLFDFRSGETEKYFRTFTQEQYLDEFNLGDRPPATDKFGYYPSTDGMNRWGQAVMKSVILAHATTE